MRRRIDLRAVEWWAWVLLEIFVGVVLVGVLLVLGEVECLKFGL